MYIPRRVKVVLIFFAFLFCVTGMLTAEGQSEDRLPEAAALIEEKKYNEATDIIVEVIKTSPERRDEADVLLKQIMTARNSINDKFSQLIESYKNRDLETAYALIKELEAMDEEPNQAFEDSLINAKAAAIFVASAIKFEEYMERAYEYIQQNNLWQAVLTYNEGLNDDELGKEVFDEAEYDNLLTTGINKTIADVYIEINNYITLEKSFKESTAAAETGIVDEEPDLYKAVFLPVYDLMLSFAETDKILEDVSRTLQSYNLNLIESTGIKDVVYLSFQRLFLLGREKTGDGDLVTWNEGISGIIKTLWESTVEKLIEASSLNMITRYNSANTNLASDNLNGADTEYRKTLEFARLSSMASSLWGKRLYPGNNFSLSEDERNIILQYAPGILYAETIEKACENNMTLILKKRRVAELSDTVNSDTAVPEDFPGIREELLSINKLVLEDKKGWELSSADYSELSFLDIDVRDNINLTIEMINRLETYSETIISTDIAFMERKIDIAYDPLQDLFVLQQNTVSEADLDIYGRVISTDTTGLETREYYPDAGKSSLLESKKQLTIITTGAETILEDMRIKESYILSAESINNQILITRKLITDVESLEVEIDSLISISNEKMFASNGKLNEARSRIAEADRLKQENRFDEAKIKLDEAGTRYFESLEFWTRENVFTEYENINSLYIAIDNAHNNLIVKQVAELREEGKRLANAGEFESADVTFRRAQSLWRETHDEDSTIIAKLLEQVENAIAATSNFELSATDSDYQVNIDALNMAKEYFEDGVSQWDAADKDSAMDFFQKADNKLSIVTGTQPRNNAANVLTLRIMQYTQEEDLNVILKDRYNEALAAIETDEVGAYSQFIIIQEINPDYPGLKTIIYDLEIALQIRVKPITTAVKNESAALYKSALTYYSRGDLVFAEKELEKAINLYSENQEALRLYDIVSRELGGGEPRILSSTDERIYRIAEDDYYAGNFKAALEAIDRLWEDELKQLIEKVRLLKEAIQREI